MTFNLYNYIPIKYINCLRRKLHEMHDLYFLNYSAQVVVKVARAGEFYTEIKLNY